PEVRRRVVCVLCGMGSAADVAIPKLIRMLQDKSSGDNLRWTIAVDLGHLGPRARDAVPVLLHILQTEGVDMQNGAVNALGKLGQDDKRVVPALIKALDHQDSRVYIHAAGALVQLGREPDVSIPALIAFLKKHKGKRDHDQPRYYVVSDSC